LYHVYGLSEQILVFDIDLKHCFGQVKHLLILKFGTSDDFIDSMLEGSITLGNSFP
jgi:hypothetical protein